MPNKFPQFWRYAGMVACTIFALTGCAVTYVDRKTGDTVVQGFVRIRAAPVSGAPFSVTDVSSLGVSLTSRSNDHAFVLGYAKTRYVIAYAGIPGSMLLTDGEITCMSADDQCLSERSVHD